MFSEPKKSELDQLFFFEKNQAPVFFWGANPKQQKTIAYSKQLRDQEKGGHLDSGDHLGDFFGS